MGDRLTARNARSGAEITVASINAVEENTMSTFRRGLMAAGLTLAMGAAVAQGGPGMGPGMQGRHGPMALSGTDFTPGWSMMTSTERAAHRGRMASMKTYDECRAYVDKTHEEMAARAKEKGGQPLAAPRHDGCAGLKH
jgi:hypothetical protein